MGKNCIDCGKDISEKRANAIRCDECQKKHKQEADRLGIAKKRKENPEHEIFRKLGTTDFGSKLRRKKDGSPDFDREAEIVHNENVAVLGKKKILDNGKEVRIGSPTTPGDRRIEYDEYGNPVPYYESPPKYEQAYSEDYDSTVNIHSDQDRTWTETLENIEEKEEDEPSKKKKTLKDVYEEWKDGY